MRPSLRRCLRLLGEGTVVVRVMFLLYALVTVLGLAFFITTGVLHR